MSADLLARIERDLSKMGDDLWNIDGPDDILDTVLKRLLLLKAQLEVQKSLQATANLLRHIPSDKALPKQRATKVKHLVRFTFRKNSRQELLKRGAEGDGGDGGRGGEEGRHRKLHKLDCDALKLCGLSYTTDEIVKMGDTEFEVLQKRVVDFISHHNLSYLLYRPDVDKAVDSKLEDPEDDELFDVFMQTHTARRLSTRKRKYDAIASPNEAAQGPIKTTINTELEKYRDAFAVNREDARYALSSDEDIGDIYLTNPKIEQNPEIERNIKDKKSFLTAWISEEMGIYLGKRGRILGY